MENASCCRRLIALRCSLGFLRLDLIKSGNLLFVICTFYDEIRYVGRDCVN